jgi:hypothetical protein
MFYVYTFLRLTNWEWNEHLWCKYYFGLSLCLYLLTLLGLKSFCFKFIFSLVHIIFFWVFHFYVLFCIALHTLVASVASEYSADGSTFSRSGEQHWTPSWNDRTWRTVDTNFRLGKFLEDKTTTTNYHEAFTSACTTGGENMYWQVSTDEWDLKFQWTYDVMGFTVPYFDKLSLGNQLCCFRA